MIHLTSNIYAVVMPEEVVRIEKLNKESIPLALVGFKENGSSWLKNIGTDFKILGVISGGEIPDELNFQSWFGIELLTSKGIDLAKTIVIIKTTE